MFKLRKNKKNKKKPQAIYIAFLVFMGIVLLFLIPSTKKSYDDQQLLKEFRDETKIELMDAEQRQQHARNTHFSSEGEDGDVYRIDIRGADFNSSNNIDTPFEQSEDQNVRVIPQ